MLSTTLLSVAGPDMKVHMWLGLVSLQAVLETTITQFLKVGGRLLK